MWAPDRLINGHFNSAPTSRAEMSFGAAIKRTTKRFAMFAGISDRCHCGKQNGTQSQISSKSYQGGAPIRFCTAK
jgi:hypothetical protein